MKKKNESSAGRILQNLNAGKVRNLVHEVMTHKSPLEIKQFLNDVQAQKNQKTMVFDT